MPGASGTRAKTGPKYNTQTRRHTPHSTCQVILDRASSALAQNAYSHNSLGVWGLLPNIGIRSCQGTELALKHAQGTGLCLRCHLQDQEIGVSPSEPKKHHTLNSLCLPFVAHPQSVSIPDLALRSSSSEQVTQNCQCTSLTVPSLSYETVKLRETTYIPTT